MSVLHTFLGILEILKNDKSFDKKKLRLIIFPLIEIISTLKLFRILSNDN
jgi:hypothetical protein